MSPKLVPLYRYIVLESNGAHERSLWSQQSGTLESGAISYNLVAKYTFEFKYVHKFLIVIVFSVNRQNKEYRSMSKVCNTTHSNIKSARYIIREPLLSLTE